MMTPTRFKEITSSYKDLSLTLAGDFCLDRYLEIDPSLSETSIETGLEVHNVTRVRSQPGGAGTILNNLMALGIGRVLPVGFAGRDGEGTELVQAIQNVPCVDWSLDSFIQTGDRRTFTYCKPLLCYPGQTPRELNRLDFKNWSPTPDSVIAKLSEKLRSCLDQSSAVVMLDQVDKAGTGAIHPELIQVVRSALDRGSIHLTLADSRQRIRDFSGLGIKVNRDEFAAWHQLTSTGTMTPLDWLNAVRDAAAPSGQPLFISLSESGIVGVGCGHSADWCPAHPVYGEIDIVGAGDCTTANLICALAAGANPGEAMEIAMAAASIVIHKLGTTGTASIQEIQSRLFNDE